MVKEQDDDLVAEIARYCAGVRRGVQNNVEAWRHLTNRAEKLERDREKWEHYAGTLGKERGELKDALLKNSVVVISDGREMGNVLWCCQCQRRQLVLDNKPFEHSETCIVKKYEARG